MSVITYLKVPTNEQTVQNQRQPIAASSCQVNKHWYGTTTTVSQLTAMEDIDISRGNLVG